MVLAGCSNSGSSIPAGSPSPPPQQLKFSHLFSFSGSDGKHPSAALIEAGGTLYGTTYGGGAYDTGTAFEIATSGEQTVLHSFAGGTDGALPEASLLYWGGALYGTTVNGGGPGEEGVVFKLEPSGEESILHRFGAQAVDGANPYAGLVEAGGAFFGVTAGGGEYSQGAVFTISTAGKESLLYDFGASETSGSTPVGGLTAVGGDLYGTTVYGGTSYTSKNCYEYGCGTIFQIDASGKLTTLYNFKGGTDGALPMAAMIDVDGTLYGTTTEGGTANDGTIFALTTSGRVRVLYSFKGGRDGAGPQGLADADGMLFGTTSAGGGHNDGTIFEATTSGNERVLYTFQGGVDGAVPRSGLANVDGTLYGTTSLGGSGGYGTIFKLTP